MSTVQFRGYQGAARSGAPDSAKRRSRRPPLLEVVGNDKLQAKRSLCANLLKTMLNQTPQGRVLIANAVCGVAAFDPNADKLVRPLAPAPLQLLQQATG
jgi:hypothetical protein